MAKKYHPGQYAAIPRENMLQAMQKALTPGLKGFQIRLYMRELEPAKGVYDFSTVAAALSLCESYQKQLIVMIIDKTFINDNPLSMYLRQYALPNRPGGYTMARWLPTPVARMIAMIRALGIRFDKHPRLEGVALQESSLSLSDNTQKLHGYTPELYRDALIKIINSANASLPTTRVFWYMNYLDGHQGYIKQVAAAIAPGGHLMGGPDWLPDAFLLQRETYPFYKLFKDQMPTFISAQYDSYKHIHRSASKTKYWTCDELYDSAKAQIFIDYFLWTYLPRPHLADSYCYEDAKPVIARDVPRPTP